jgi:hypothetical protein
MKKSILLIAAVLLATPFLAAVQAQQSLDIKLMSCTEILCTSRKDVFLVGEYAYIDYNSSVKGLIVAGALRMPDGTSYQIMFPNRITSNTTGNFTVDLVAWKEGYQETMASKVVQFVDVLPDGNATGPPAEQNPLRIDIVPVIAVIIALLIVLGAWRYSKRKVHHKKESKRI